MNTINPFVEINTDQAKQLLLDLQSALDALAEIPGYTAESALLMRCVESAYVDAIETEPLA